ncbi:hypothetical protein [Jannaschia donghaensis]|uniref:Curlin minor subunit CsgB n=1 Tax=Jannaschia donghaensis TaxID=420998 RepID=A0A0M6YKP5_9RHOB|nr:hypothetical protein [Jannaschia donghaensis]CTQ50941.1 hypothetical protein JDO7802_02972 [Jannaschia donghaensis]
MKTFVTGLIAAAALTAPVYAEVATGPAAAIAHFNQDADSQDGRSILTDGSTGVTVSTRSGNTGAAFDLFNAQADSQDDVRGQNGGTSFSGRAPVASDIFSDIAAASSEDE